MHKKICSKCKKKKEVKEFFKRKSNKDGLRCQCKECEYIAKNIVNSYKRRSRGKSFSRQRKTKIIDKSKLFLDYRLELIKKSAEKYDYDQGKAANKDIHIEIDQGFEEALDSFKKFLKQTRALEF